MVLVGEGCPHQGRASPGDQGQDAAEGTRGASPENKEGEGILLPPGTLGSAKSPHRGAT